MHKYHLAAVVLFPSETWHPVSNNVH